MKQLIRFCIVGCLNFAISYSVFYLSYRYWPFSTMLPGGMDLLHRLGISSIDGASANVLGFVAGMANSFVWNRLWTFKSLEKTHKQAIRFVITNIACLLLSTASIFVCTDLNHWPYKPVWFITMVFVTVINFIASKYWVFASKSSIHSGGRKY